MAGETVAAAFVRGVLDYARSRGADPTALAARAQISSTEVASPEQRVPFDKYIQLIRAAKEACADPAFALHFGEAVDMRQMSIAALFGQTCENGLQAFEAANRYSKLDVDLDTGGGDRFRLVERSGSLWLVDMRADPNHSPEVTESGFARMASAARVMGLQMPLRQVHVTHPQPPYHREYRRIFGVPVTFAAEWNALELDRSVLSMRIGLQPALAGTILAERADSLLRELEDGSSFGRAVEATLRPLLASGVVTSKAVAARLGTSRQTLYRRLKAEGLTYEAVLDGLRHRLAEQALSDGEQSVTQIAYHLGFADHSSFTKAFKRWTGEAPGRRRGRRALSNTL